MLPPTTIDGNDERCKKVYKFDFRNTGTDKIKAETGPKLIERLDLDSDEQRTLAEPKNSIFFQSPEDGDTRRQEGLKKRKTHFQLSALVHNLCFLA